MIIEVVILAFSIVMLYYGAEFALESGEKIGASLGMSPLVIGLLIVGFGTSLPEFFVSQLACLRGESEIALGNIVGSNIANLFLILGISGLMTTLHIVRKQIKIQLVFHVALTAILILVLVQDRLYTWAALVFGGFFAVYLYDTFKQMKKHKLENKELETQTPEKVVFKDYLFLIIGFVLLYLGGEFLVRSGSSLAKFAGVSSYVISAVFVAFGTSFPELVTAIMACKKKKDTDIITGNIIGSNIFNVAFVLGSLTFYDVPINNNFYVEIGVLTFAALFLLGLSMLKKNFGTKSGVLFLFIYISTVVSWVM